MIATFRATKGDGGKGTKCWGVVRETSNLVDWYLNPYFSRAEAQETAKRENSREVLISKYGTDDFLEIARIMARA